MKVRKPISELTLEDLDMHPVWEYAIDEEEDEDQDETTVRPIDISEIRQLEDGSIISRRRAVGRPRLAPAGAEVAEFSAAKIAEFSAA